MSAAYVVASATGNTHSVQIAFEKMTAGERQSTALLRVSPPVYVDPESRIWDYCVGGFYAYEIEHFATTKSASLFLLTNITRPDMIATLQESAESLVTQLDAIEEANWEEM